MNAFSGLAQVTQVSINAVAPGIAEALIATALGLFAAIPALISYNWSVKSIDAIIRSYENFSSELLITYEELNDQEKTKKYKAFNRNKCYSIRRRFISSACDFYGSNSFYDPRHRFRAS